MQHSPVLFSMMFHQISSFSWEIRKKHNHPLTKEHHIFATIVLDSEGEDWSCAIFTLISMLPRRLAEIWVPRKSAFNMKLCVNYLWCFHANARIIRPIANIIAHGQSIFSQSIGVARARFYMDDWCSPSTPQLRYLWIILQDCSSYIV